MSSEESLGGLDPEIAALVGAAPDGGDFDLSKQIVEEAVPTAKELAAEKAAAPQVPTAHDQDRTVQRQIGKYWASLVPGATMAIVYHKPHSGPGAGALRIINRYNIRDIQAGGGDVTLFTLNNLSPTWGPGDYHYYVVDPKTHREVHVAHVPVAEKPSGAKEAEEVSLANTLMQHILNDAREQKKAVMSQQPPDPFAQLAKAQELMKTLTGGESKTDPLMLMMVMQMMQPKPEPPKMDPMLASLLDRMDRRMEAMEKKVESAASAGPPPPPPPPPPQVDVVEVIAKLAPLLKPEPPPKPEVTAMDLVRILQEQHKNEERLGLRDVLGLIDRREARERPEATLAEKIQEFVALRELSSQAFGGGGGGETNFWDAVSRFLEHPALGAGVGRAIEASAKNRGQQNPVVVSHRPAQQQAPRQVPAPVAPAGHIPAQAQQAAQETVSEEAPKIPEAVQQHLQAIQDSLQIPNEIESRKARVLATIQTLVVLWNDPNWNKFVVELLTHVTQNNKEMALKGLGGFLGFMHYHGLLDPAAGKAAYLDFREAWDELQPELTKSLGGFLQMAPQGAAEEESEEETEDTEEPEEEAEETEAAEAPAPAASPLFVTSLPKDDIESLYQEAQRNVI